MSENHSADQIQMIDQAIGEFEEAWAGGQFVTAREFVQKYAALSSGLLPELVVSEFECRLEFGRPISLEELLREYPEVRAVDDCVLRVVAADWIERRQESTAPAPETYVAIFPHLGPAICEYLQVVSVMSSEQHRSINKEVRRSIGGSFGHRSTSSDNSNSPEVNLEGTVIRLTDECELTTRLSTEGAYKDVYRGRQRSTGRIVAAKVLKHSHLGRAEERHRFLGEGRTQALLDHQNIPPVFLINGDSDSPPILMEKLVTGEEWSRTLRTRTTPENLAVLQKVSNAARYAHRRSRPLIHRDIKPANVVINDEFQEVYLVDWGFVLDVSDASSLESSAPHRSQEADTIIGTLGYMSPEQALGRVSKCSPASDVFSLGAILYEILTGASPYGDTSLRNGLRRAWIAAIEPPQKKVAPRTLPVELCEIAMRALSADPALRYRDAGEFAEAIQHYLNHAAAEEQCQIARTRWQKLRQRATETSGSTKAHRHSTELIEIADQFRQARKAWEHPDASNDSEAITDVGYQQARDSEREARQELIEHLRGTGDLTLALAQVDELRGLVPATESQPLREVVSRAIRRRRIGQLWLRGSVMVVLLLIAFAAFSQARTAKALADVNKLEIDRLRNVALDEARRRKEAQEQLLIEEQRRQELEEKRIAIRDKRRAESQPMRAKATLARRDGFSQAEVAMLGRILGDVETVEALPDQELTLLRAQYQEARQQALRPLAVSSRRVMTGVVALHPDGKLMVSGDLTESSLRVWDVESGELLFKLRGHSVPEDRGGPWATIRGLAFSQTRPDELLSIGLDGTIRVWSLGERRELRSQQNPASPGSTSLIQLLTVDVSDSSKTGSGLEARIVTGDLQGRLRWSHYDDLSEIKTVAGHRGAVLDVRFSRDGAICVSAGADGNVRLWSAAGDSLGELRVPSPEANANPVEAQSVAFSADGQQVAAGMGDGRIHVWSTSDRGLLRTLEGHSPGPSGLHSIRNLAAVGNNQLLSCGADGTLKLWNLNDGALTRTFAGHAPNQYGNAAIRSFAWNAASQQLVSTGADDTIRFWDFERGKPRRSLEGGLTKDERSIPLVTRVAHCPERDLLLTSALAVDVSIRRWDTSSLRETGGYAGLPELPNADQGDRVHGLAIHPQGTRFVSVEPTGELLLWNTETGQLEKTIAAHTPLKLPPLQGVGEIPPMSITAVAWSHNGQWVASTGYDRMLKLWNGETGEAVAEWSLADDMLTSSEAANQQMARSALTGLPAQAYLALSQNPPETALVFDAQDKRLITLGRDRAVRIWNIADKKLEQRLVGHVGRITSGVLSAGGNLLATGSDDGFVFLWDMQKLSPKQVLHLTPLLLPDRFGPGLTTNSEWRINAEQERERFARQVISLAMSPNETTLAASLGDGSVSLIDVGAGSVTHRAVGHEPSAYGMSTVLLAYRRSGDLLSIGSDQTIRRWGIGAGGLVMQELSRSTEVQGGRDLAASEDGEWALAGNNFNLVRWPRESTEPVQWRPEKNAAYSVAYVPGTRKLVVGTLLGRAFVHDRDSNQELLTFRGSDGQREFPRKAVNAIVAVSPDGSLAASSWTNGDVDLWRVESGQFVRTLKHSGAKIYALAFHPQKSELAITDEDGNLRIWDWRDESATKPRLTLRGPQQASGLEYSRNGRWLVQSGQRQRNTALSLWDAETGRSLHVSLGHKPVQIVPGMSSVTVFDASFSPDGKLLATCGNDATVRFWRLKEKEGGLDVSPANIVSLTALTGTIAKPANSEPKTGENLALDTSSVSTWLISLSFSRDGRQVAVAGLSGPIRVIDVEREDLAQWTPERVRQDAENLSGLSVLGEAVVPLPRNTLHEVRATQP